MLLDTAISIKGILKLDNRVGDDISAVFIHPNVSNSSKIILDTPGTVLGANIISNYSTGLKCHYIVLYYLRDNDYTLVLVCLNDGIGEIETEIIINNHPLDVALFDGPKVIVLLQNSVFIIFKDIDDQWTSSNIMLTSPLKAFPSSSLPATSPRPYYILCSILIYLEDKDYSCIVCVDSRDEWFFFCHPSHPFILNLPQCYASLTQCMAVKRLIDPDNYSIYAGLSTSRLLLLHDGALDSHIQLAAVPTRLVYHNVESGILICYLSSHDIHIFSSALDELLIIKNASFAVIDYLFVPQPFQNWRILFCEYGNEMLNFKSIETENSHSVHFDASDRVLSSLKTRLVTGHKNYDEILQRYYDKLRLLAHGEALVCASSAQTGLNKGKISTPNCDCSDELLPFGQNTKFILHKPFILPASSITDISCSINLPMPSISSIHTEFKINVNLWIISVSVSNCDSSIFQSLYLSFISHQRYLGRSDILQCLPSKKSSVLKLFLPLNENKLLNSCLDIHLYLNYTLPQNVGTLCLSLGAITLDLISTTCNSISYPETPIFDSVRFDSKKTIHLAIGSTKSNLFDFLPALFASKLDMIQPNSHINSWESSDLLANLSSIAANSAELKLSCSNPFEKGLLVRSLSILLQNLANDASVQVNWATPERISFISQFLSSLLAEVNICVAYSEAPSSFFHKELMDIQSSTDLFASSLSSII